MVFYTVYYIVLLSILHRVGREGGKAGGVTRLRLRYGTGIVGRKGSFLGCYALKSPYPVETHRKGANMVETST